MAAVTEKFTPGYRLIDGSDLNTAFDQVNDGFDGSTPGTYTGTFNGTVGATTPATGAFTYASQSVGVGLTAAGTTRANALQLAAAINTLTTVAASTGVVLPPAASVGIGGVVTIFNAGASPVQVYATGSETVDGTAGATGVALTNANRCQYFVTSATTWVSAKLGVVSS